MWRQTQVARRAYLARIKNFNTLQTPPPSSSSQVLLDSPHQIVSLHSREFSPHLPRWGFRKSPSFQPFRPFSSDSVVQPVPDPDLDSNSNPDVDQGVLEGDGIGLAAHGEDQETLEFEGVEDGEDQETLEFEGVEDGEDEEIVENDVEKVETLLSLLQSSGGDVEKEFVGRLDEMGLVLSEEFVVRVLGTPHVPAQNFVAFYGWCLGKRRFSVTMKTVDMLVRVVCAESDKFSAYMLWDLLKRVGKGGVLSTEILNQLVSLFSRIREGEAAYEVFDKFEEFRCVPDSETFYYTIEALFKSSLLDFAASVSQKMVTMEMLPEAEKIGNLICYLSKRKMSRDAHSVYLLAKEKNKSPPRSSLNVLIDSLCFLPRKDNTETRDDVDKFYRENICMALEILDNLSDEDRKSAGFQPFASVCQALCTVGDVDKAKGLLFSMIKSGPPPGSAIFNPTITGLSKAGEVDEAKNLLKVIEERGLKPDVDAYTAIMSGYAEGGSMVEARQVLEEAKQRHAKLTPATYHTMIRGYCKLEQFDEAVQLLAEMQDYGVQTTASAYDKVIQSLCNALDWEMAEKLLEEMKEKGLLLNEATKSLVRAVKELEEEGKETQEVGI